VSGSTLSEVPFLEKRYAGKDARLRVAIVTNIPVPYREPVLEALSRTVDFETHVFFCSDREPDREWRLPSSHYPRTVLRRSFLTVRGRFIHVNFDVIRALARFDPHVIVTNGFNPTHLFAYAYSRWRGRTHVAMTDGTLESERKLSYLHRAVRRIVYRGSRAFIGASHGSRRLYESYGISPDQIFRSVLCADNNRFIPYAESMKRFDLLFCGRLVEVKNPLFALEIARHASKRLGRRTSILFIGSGPLEVSLRNAAARQSDADVSICGFVQHDELPRLYGQARIFLFPSQWDPWGVVANEAAAAGLPVVISQHAGAAHELIIDGRNGYVLPLDAGLWTDAITKLLTDDKLYDQMSRAARVAVTEYTFASAASGIASAVRAASPEPSFPVQVNS